MQVYHLMELIENVVRQHLNTQHVYNPRTDFRKRIVAEVLRSEPILASWEEIAQHIPAKYELYSLELLQEITELWVTVRGHSFSKEWTMKFERKYKKGTRKTMKTVDKK